MSLLLPDSGLLFWMLLSFVVVLFVLGKFAFPFMTKMIDERKKYIDQSLEHAREANEKLARVKEESEAILAQAREEHAKIMRDAAMMRDSIVDEARKKAQAESDRLLQETKDALQKERENTIREMRKQTADLCVDIAEKVLRKNLESDDQQMSLVERLLDEVKISKS